TFGAAHDGGTADGPTQIVTADFDGDGKLDVATLDPSDAAISVLLGKGNGALALKLDTALGGVGAGLVAGDFDGDGRVDLAVSDPSYYQIRLSLGRGDGTFAGTAMTSSGGYSVRALAAGDLDGNGQLDVVSADDNQTIDIFLGNGNGSFQTLHH